MTSEVSATDAAMNNDLLDTIITSMRLKNDAALSRLLEVQPPVTSKIRHGRLPIGSALLIRIHEVTDWPIREIKAGIGQRSLDLYKPVGAQ